MPAISVLAKRILHALRVDRISAEPLLREYRKHLLYSQSCTELALVFESQIFREHQAQDTFSRAECHSLSNSDSRGASDQVPLLVSDRTLRRRFRLVF